MGSETKGAPLSIGTMSAGQPVWLPPLRCQLGFRLFAKSFIFLYILHFTGEETEAQRSVLGPRAHRVLELGRSPQWPDFSDLHFVITLSWAPPQLDTGCGAVVGAKTLGPVPAFWSSWVSGGRCSKDELPMEGLGGLPGGGSTWEGIRHPCFPRPGEGF